MIPLFYLRYVYLATTVIVCLVILIYAVSAYKSTRRAGFGLVAWGAFSSIWISLVMQIFSIYLPALHGSLRIGYPYLFILNSALFASGFVLITRDFVNLSRREKP